MAKNRVYNSWRYALAFIVLFQIIVIYDTVRKSQNKKRHEPSEDLRIARINGDVLSSIDPSKRRSRSAVLSESKNDDENNSNSGSEDTQDEEDPLWLNHKQIEDYHHADYYSGSWLMPMNRFESLKAKGINVLEDASHLPFYENKENVRMPVDWLDFSTEHMSRWFKDLDVVGENHNEVGINLITRNLMKYIQDTPERTKALLAESEPYAPSLNPTIAIISSGSLIRGDGDVEVRRSANLTVTTLGATIASLLRAGVGRIVCTGVNDADEVSVKETYALLAEQYTDRGDWIATTEFSYVQMEEELYKSDLVDVNRPRGSIYGLQSALRGDFNESYTEAWLGNVRKPDFWRYVYFTEPDLVLQTRLSSLPAIHDALESGRVLMPHRFELNPHEADLSEDGKLYNGNMLPAKGKFLDILDLDGDVDMCCDGGNDRPSWDKEDDPTEHKCGDWWWRCGYNNHWIDAGISEEVKHRRILNYTPFIRLMQGVNIVAISGTEHERKCHPRKRRSSNDVCERN